MLPWAQYTFVNTKNDQKKLKGEITIYILGPVQTLLHSRAKRNSIKFDKGGKFLKKLWCCIVGECYKKIWFYQLGW